MKGAVWFILSCKRCLKRLPFLALLFLLPLGALALSGTGRGEDDRIRIALCAQDPSGLAVRTVQALTEPSKMRGICLCSMPARMRKRFGPRWPRGGRNAAM